MRSGRRAELTVPPMHTLRPLRARAMVHTCIGTPRAQRAPRARPRSPNAGAQEHLIEANIHYIARLALDDGSRDQRRIDRTGEGQGRGQGRHAQVGHGSDSPGRCRRQTANDGTGALERILGGAPRLEVRARREAQGHRRIGVDSGRRSNRHAGPGGQRVTAPRGLRRPRTAPRTGSARPAPRAPGGACDRRPRCPRPRPRVGARG